MIVAKPEAHSRDQFHSHPNYHGGISQWGYLQKTVQTRMLTPAPAQGKETKQGPTLAPEKKVKPALAMAIEQILPPQTREISTSVQALVYTAVAKKAATKAPPPTETIQTIISP